MKIRLLITIGILTSALARADDGLSALTEVPLTSSLDGTAQPTLYWAPAVATSQPRPLFVFLHSWSGDYRQDNSKWQREAVKRDWIYVHPNFRGRNDSPPACGSRLARQDILDAMDFASRTFQVDPSRIYLAGVSGGGHMALLMAGHHADRFSAVSAWVGISDLARWYEFHTPDGQPGNYAKMIAKSLGGPPGTSTAIDADYRDRSPLFHLHQVGELPVDILAGVNDGHTGSVPVWHSLAAFNKIAEAHGDEPVTEAEGKQLWDARQLTHPQPTDTAEDPVLGREIRLRRTSGPSRVTIFEGGHESIPAAAIHWLEQHRRVVQ